MPFNLEDAFDSQFGTDARNPPKTVGHEGMFGIKGVGRNILGLLGDAFLVQAGRDPYYRQKVQQEQMGDAMSSFTDNPLGAIQALASMGRGKEANELLDSLTKRINDTRTSTASAGANNALAADRMVETGDKRLAPIYGVLGSVKDASAYPYAVDLARKMAAQRGIDLPFDLPEQYDESALNAIVGGAISPEKRMQAESLDNYREAQGLIQAGRLRLEGQRLANDIRKGATTAQLQAAEQQGRSAGTMANMANQQTRTAGKKPKQSNSQPPRSGRFKGETATSPTGTVFKWDGKDWIKQ